MISYPARAIIDLRSVRDNVSTLVGCAPTAEVMAVVKGDGYGHGLLPSARAALAGGATWLGTAQLSEALALRAAGIDCPILTWLHAPGAPLDQVVASGIDLSVSAHWALQEIVEAARTTDRVARVHMKVDTGMGRNGATVADYSTLLDAALRAQSDGTVRIVGVWSHLAWADSPEHPAVRDQLEAFQRAVALAERKGAKLELRHLANSAALLTNPATHFDLVRPGLAVYGLSPVPALGTPAEFGLTPAMTLEADLALVKEVTAGQGVSYEQVYTTTRQTMLGLVPIGYADGVPRLASGTETGSGGPVQINGRRVGVAGRVCMDQFVVDLGPDALEAAGDRVVLFGAGTDGEPTAQDWAVATHTISYEIVTRVGARVPRRHLGEPDTIETAPRPV